MLSAAFCGPCQALSCCATFVESHSFIFIYFNSAQCLWYRIFWGIVNYSHHIIFTSQDKMHHVMNNNLNDKYSAAVHKTFLVTEQNMEYEPDCKMQMLMYGDKAHDMFMPYIRVGF